MAELEVRKTQADLDEFHAAVDQELAIFQKGEKYDYVKDLKDAYKDSLKATSEQRIFDTIPDHVFWDIKKPQNHRPDANIQKKNRYNPFRGLEYANFFEMRDQEQWQQGQHTK